MTQYGWNGISTTGNVEANRQGYHTHAFMIGNRAVDTGAAATGEGHIHPIMDSEGVVIGFTNPGSIGRHQHYVDEIE